MPPPPTPISHVSEYLHLYEYPNFLSPSECQQLLDIPITQFKRGRTVDTGQATAQVEDDSRTSTTLTLPADKQALFYQWVAERLPSVWYNNAHEPTQLARYTEGQKYDYHHDYFDEVSLASDNANAPKKQRTWSLLVYLHDVAQQPTRRKHRTARRRKIHTTGGETHFGHPDVDITVQPKKGTAILWHNLYADGTPNPKTLHAGKPLGKGCYKTIVTQWFLENSV